MKTKLPLLALLLATLSLQPVAATAGPGYALSFNGTNNYMFMGAAPLTAPWTAEFWVNRQGSNSAAVLLSDANTALKLEQDGTGSRVGFTQYGVADYAFNYATPTNTWVHLAFVCDTTLRLYVNGSLQDTRTPTIALPLWVLGARTNNNGVGTLLRAMVDEVRVWNVARSAAEIQADMSLTPNVADPNLRAYWPFNEGTGSTTADASGHAHTGALVNNPAWVSGVVWGPTLVAQPTNVTAFVGTPAQLSVLATNPAPLSYQWYRQGKGVIAGATNATLAWSSLAVSNAGNYYVVVSNAYGAITSHQAVVVPVNWQWIGANPLPQPITAPFTDPGAMLTTPVVAVSGGHYHSLALQADGTVVAWGWNAYGQTTVPATATNVVAIAAGTAHSLALQADGTVVAWGRNDYGQTTVPANATNVVAIAGGGGHSLALKADGTVVAWGRNDYGQTTVPANATNVVAIAGGANWGSGGHSLALKADGTVVAWGRNAYGQTTVPANATNVVAIAGGREHSLALKADGTVVAWGDNSYGQANVPANATNVVAIAGGGGHSLALQADGTVVGWGWNDFGSVATVPPTATNVVAIAGGAAYSLALQADGTVVAWGWNDLGQADVPTFAQTILATSGTVDTDVVGTYTLTYSYTNGLGTVLTTNRMVVVNPVAPTLGSVTGVVICENGTARLNLTGDVNPNGLPTSAWFEWGNDANYGNHSPVAQLAAGSTIQTVSTTLSNLTLGLSCYVRLVASNSLGLVQGSGQEFSVPSQPAAETLAASSIAYDVAQLNGSLNPHGLITTAWFEWGATTNYGQLTAATEIPASDMAQPVNMALIGLTPGASYHFRLIVTNGLGVVTGADFSFSTLPPVFVTATTLSASNLDFDGATLNGAVNPNGLAATTWFEWGTTTNYGQRTALAQIDPTNVSQGVSQLLQGLTPGASYHFWLLATNRFGLAAGEDFSFSTLPPVFVTAITLSASNLDFDGATLRGAVNPNGLAATAWFEWGSTTNYGQRTALAQIAPTNVSQGVSLPLQGLTPGASYHFRLLATNRFGLAVGADLTCATLPPETPTVTTLAASGIYFDAAMLNGAVNPKGLAATAWFEWGGTTNYGQVTSPVEIFATNGAQLWLATVSGLAPGHTYHFRLLATNRLGLVAGADLTMATLPPEPPAVTTLPATEMLLTSAALNGTVNPKGLTTTAWFEWGTNASYGQKTQPAVIPALATNQAVSVPLNSLTTNQMYHCRLVATNQSGLNYGADIVFAMGSNFKTVTTLADGGPGSLRQAISECSNGGVIVFSTNGSIGLVYGQLSIATNLTLIGPGAANLAISGNSGTRVFQIAPGAVVAISGLTIRNGHAPNGRDGDGERFPMWEGDQGQSATSGTDGESGGGIFNLGRLTLSECVFATNSAGNGGCGGAPDPSRGPLGAFAWNYDAGNGGHGGAIYNAGWLWLTNCSFSGNRSGYGGVTYSGTGSAGGSGGGIYNLGIVCLTSCTISFGAAVWGQQGIPPEDPEQDDRSAAVNGAGGGICNEASVFLHNSILAGNGAGLAPDLSGSFSSLGHNLLGVDEGSYGLFNGVQGDRVGYTGAPINPLLGTLADNGGGSLTMALLPNSPGLDNGDDGVSGTDQRGFPRRSGSHVDIGAYELQIAPLIIHSCGLTGLAQFQFQFTGPTSATYSVLCTTNLALPMNSWTPLGTAIEITTGHYQFTDSTNGPVPAQRFFSVRQTQRLGGKP